MQLPVLQCLKQDNICFCTKLGTQFCSMLVTRFEQTKKWNEPDEGMEYIKQKNNEFKLDQTVRKLLLKNNLISVIYDDTKIVDLLTDLEKKNQ